MAAAILGMGAFGAFADKEPDKKDGVERACEKVRNESVKDYNKARNGDGRLYFFCAGCNIAGHYGCMGFP